MELGATVCKPKWPLCQSCPVSAHCGAFQLVKRLDDVKKTRLLKAKNDWEGMMDIEDIAEGCPLCPSPDDKAFSTAEGVCSYPKKAKRKPPREESALVCILRSSKGRYLLVRRPDLGLLAGLPEFPTFPLEKREKVTEQKVTKAVKDLFDRAAEISSVKPVGDVIHAFSHIKQTYKVWTASLAGDEEGEDALATNASWLLEEDVTKEALPTAMKKVWEAAKSKSSKRKHNEDGEEKAQKSIKTFFGNIK